MRKITLLKSLLLLCALIVGNSSAWAGDVVYKSLTFPDDNSSNNGLTSNQYASTWTAKSGTFEWTISNFNNNNWNNNWAFIKCGRKNNASTGTIVTSTAIDKAITKVVVTIDAVTADKVNSIKLYTSSDNSEWVVAGSYTLKTGAQTVNLDSPTGNLYYKIVFDCASGSSNGLVTVSKVDYYYNNSGGNPTPTCATPTISGAQAFLNSTEVTISCETDGATIQYSTNGGTSWTNYSDPFTLNETTTVKAKATKNGMTDSEEASETFTKVTPMTVAQAITAINALADNGTLENQCVAGKVSQVDSYNSTYKSITYWISDDGSTTSQLEVYGGFGVNGAEFTAKTDLNKGDQVVVYGTLKKFVSNNKTTTEFDKNNILLSYEATGVPTPSITAYNVTIDSEATSGEISYTIDNPTGASLTAAVKEGDWISNVNVTADKVTFSVTQNTGEQRIGYITLSYTGAADKDVKITQKATFGVATVPFMFDDGKAAIETTNGLFHTGLGSDYSASPKLKFDGNGDYLVLKLNAAAELLNFDIKGNGTNENPWDGTFKVQTSSDGVTYTDLKTYNNTILTDLLHESLALNSSVRYIKWIYIEKNSGNVGVGRIGVNCEATVIPEAGYATICTPNIIDFAGTNGVTAYKVTAIGKNSVTIEEITAAPKNTPVILKATAGTYGLKVAASAADVTGNLLQVSDGTATTDDDNTVYALAMKGEPAAIGFYKVKKGTKVPAGKCYLSVAAAAPASARDFLSFSEENATSILTVNGSGLTVNGEVYDLQGRQVKQPTKGLYIKNGKKVIIK